MLLSMGGGCWTKRRQYVAEQVVARSCGGGSIG
jgi:hypothetical protein